MNNFSLWFKRLQHREQNMLIAMSSVVLLTLFYLLVWEPVFKGSELEQEKLKSQKKILSWMQNASQEVDQLRRSGQLISPQFANQSINTLIERSAISAGIRSAINKLDSDGKQAMKVQLKSVEFDKLAQWLGKLQNDFGITPKHLTINRLEQTGMVNCRITLEKISL